MLDPKEASPVRLPANRVTEVTVAPRLVIEGLLADQTIDAKSFLRPVRDRSVLHPQVTADAGDLEDDVDVDKRLSADHDATTGRRTWLPTVAEDLIPTNLGLSTFMQPRDHIQARPTRAQGPDELKEPSQALIRLTFGQTKLRARPTVVRPRADALDGKRVRTGIGHVLTLEAPLLPKAPTLPRGTPTPMAD